MRTILLLLFGCEAAPKSTTAPCEEEVSCVPASGQGECEDCDTTCQVDELPSDDQDHIEGEIDYEDLPPAGGAHNPCWAEWGVHTEPVDPVNFVHNLEHGGVVFLYNCPDGCEGELALLTEKVEALSTLALLSPYPDMDFRFAAVAWEHRLLMNCLDVDVLLAFYDERVDRGPESVASMPPDDCMD